jgi:bacterioferritin (cytochrome b1)
MQQQSEHGSARKVPPMEKNQRCAGGSTGIATSDEVGDQGSREFFADRLREEEEHANW